jgi:hypothetical protein
LIDRAEQEIDFAADALTDWHVMQALTRAADLGVAHLSQIRHPWRSNRPAAGNLREK